MRYLFFVVPVAVLIGACASDSPSGVALSGEMGPEAVVRQWQASFDHNDFENARRLSTPRMDEFLSAMEQMFATFSAETLDSTITSTEFLELSCREFADTAVCRFRVLEDGEEYVDSFRLLRLDGKWLMDIPEDTGIEPEDVFEDPFE